MELSLLLKVTLALVAGLTTAAAAGRARASVRHLVVAATFGVLLALPAMILLGPVVPVAMADDPRVSAAIAAVQRPIIRVAPSAALKQVAPEVPGAGVTVSPATLLRLVWLAGLALSVVPLTVSLSKVRRLRMNSIPWSRGRDRLLLLVPSAPGNVQVLQNDSVPAPFTCGILEPAIILPFDADSWSDAALERAFVHELEHIRRADWFVQVAARAACAIYWFHPLVWVAWRRLCVESERACDDAVLERAERTVYAEQLVTLAKRISVAPLQPILRMAGRTDLSVRVRAILDVSQFRGRAGAAAVTATAIASATFVLAVAPLQAQINRGIPRLDPFAAAIADRLLSAAAQGRTDSVRALLDGGADPNAVVPGDGTPLLVASREGRDNVVRLLLDRGADPNIAVPGDGNPLIMAAREGHLPIATLLLDGGAHVDDVVPGDETALINASAQGHLAVVRLLVARGANVNLGASAGVGVDGGADRWRTPLGMANQGGHTDVVRFLRSAGATN